MFIQSFTFWKKTNGIQLSFNASQRCKHNCNCIRNDLNHKNMNLICRSISYIFEFSYYILIYLKRLNHCRCCNTCRTEDKLNYVNTLWYYLFYLKMFYHVQKCVVYKKMIHVAVLYITDLPYLSLTMMKLLPS